MAFSILSLFSGSAATVLFADHVPVNRPVSPPRNTPAMPKNVYVMISPRPVGFNKGAMSGIACDRPSAKLTDVGLSVARKAWYMALRFARMRKAR